MAHPGGRPPKYNSTFPEQARQLTLLGATDDELAAFFCVSQRTINAWKGAHPEFSQALKDGKVKADGEVAASLRDRARGYEWDEIQPIKLKEVIYENGKRVRETERVELVEVHRVVPPDPTSAIFWLKNRRAQNWREKSQVEVTPLKKVLDDLDSDMGEQAQRALGK